MKTIIHYKKLIFLITLLIFSNYLNAQCSTYKLPFPTGTTYTCSQSNNGSTSHSGIAQYAFDFAMPINTDVCASRGGIISHIVESYSNNNNPSNCNDVNRVVINHGDGTSSLYLHLTLNGALVSVGDTVTQGQVIAKSGNSGCSTGAHLHFMVMNTAGNAWYNQSLPISFCDYPNNNGVPTSGASCTSSNCSFVPITTTPSNAQTNVGIPVFFNWDDVSGTNPQYRIQVSTTSSGWTATNGFTTALVPSVNVKVNFNTDNISQYSWSQYLTTDNPFTPQPNTTYYYTVKSFVCGQSSNYSAIKSFTTGCLATTPVLISPTNSQTNVINPINFDWQDDSGTNPLYRIQVSTVNSGWTVQDGFTTNTSPTGNVVVNQNTSNVSAYQWSGGQSGTTYYWTVRTNSCNHSSPYSPVRSFTIGNNTPCNPPTVTLNTPANGTTYNIGQTISLQWTGVENGCAIQDYQIEITAPNGNSTSPTQTTTSFNFTATTAGVGTWQWRVRARNINGVYGNYTSSRTFIISQTTTSYTISTSSNPPIGGTTTGNGTYSNGSNLTVTASANSGYIFSNWTENNTVVSTNATYQFTISSNRNLVANFSIPNTGQGCIGGTQFPSFSLNPTNTWQVQNTIFAGEYAVFNVINNQTYTWSLCEADGGYTNYDSQLTLRNNLNGNYISYSDDFCGTNAKITWTSYFDGQVRVLVNQYNCSSNTNATTLAYKSENTLNTTEIENKLDIKVYPNPIEDILNIDSKEKIISKIEIIDIQGRLIFKDNYNKNKIEINSSSFENGTYVIKVYFENEQLIYKIIKN